MIAIEKIRLSQVGVLRMGETIIEKDCTGEGLPVYSADKSNRPWAYSSHFKRINKQGTIVIGARGTIGHPRLPLDNQFGATQTTITLQPSSDSFLPEFVYYALQQLDFTQLGAQQAVPMLTVANLNDVTIPMLLKPEQTQIVSILSTLDQAIEQTEAIIAKQQRIKAGLMQDLLTKGIDEHGVIRSEATHQFKDSPLGRVPVEWEVEALGSVIEIIDPNPSHRYPPSSDVGVPIASTENFVGDNDFDLSWADRVPLSVFEKQRQRCNYIPDDVIFARKGRLGLARPYGNEDKVFSHTVVVLKPRNGSVSPRFILWMVRFRQFFDEIDKRMNSNSGVPTLGVAFIGAVPVLIPKPEEQARIVALLDNAEVAAEKELMQLQKIKKVKTGLMHDLLTGTVRVANH